MQILQLTPVVAALAVIVPGIAALMIERDEMPDFVKLVTTSVDDATTRLVKEMLGLSGPTH